MQNPPSRYKNGYANFFLDESDDGLTRWLKSISLLSALIALIIFTDYFLPLTKEAYEVKEAIVRTGFDDYNYETYSKLKHRSGDEEFWLILDKEEIAISEKDLIQHKTGDTIVIFKTVIFGLHVKFQNTKFYPFAYFYPYLNVYGYFILFPVAFLLIFVFTVIYKKKTELILSLGVINIIMLVSFGFLMLFY